MTTKEKALTLAKELEAIYPDARIELQYTTPFELVVAVVLSAQTTDKQVNIVTSNLFKKYRTIKDYVTVSLDEFEKDIKRIGLYRTKAKNILSLAKIIHEQYNDKIPDSMEELTSLPGIGRKTANIILASVYGKIEGIAVDTHVSRLSQLFGLTKHKDPLRIERDLMALLPKKEWFNFAKRLILYGRYICTARCKHTDCPLREFISE